MKNYDLGLENAALGLRPWAAFSRPRSQVFTIRTSQPANNIYIYILSLTLPAKYILDNNIHTCNSYSQLLFLEFFEITTLIAKKTPEKLYLWIKEKFSREYHLVCTGKTNRPSQKGLLKFATNEFSALKCFECKLTQNYISPRKKKYWYQLAFILMYRQPNSITRDCHFLSERFKKN